MSHRINTRSIAAPFAWVRGVVYLLVVIASAAGHTGRLYSQSVTHHPSSGEPAAPDAVTTGSLLAADLFLPGFGAAYQGRFYQAASIFTLRVASGYAAYHYYLQSIKFRSLERASDLAGYRYGPGYLFYNPFDGGFHSHDYYHRQADISAYYVNLSLLLHGAVTIGSMILTGEELWQQSDQAIPIFHIDRDGRIEKSTPRQELRRIEGVMLEEQKIHGTRSLSGIAPDVGYSAMGAGVTMRATGLTESPGVSAYARYSNGGVELPLVVAVTLPGF